MHSQLTPQLVQVLNSFKVADAPAETVQLYNLDGTIDSGAAIGEFVIGKIASAPIVNKLGDRIGHYSESGLGSSIVFTSAVADPTKEVAYNDFGNIDGGINATQTAMADSPNGAFSINYRNGLILIKKANTDTTLSISSYKVQSGGGETTIVDGSGNSIVDSGVGALKILNTNPDYTHHAAALQYSRDNHTNATIDSILDCSDYDVAVVQFVKRGGTDTVTFTAEASAEDNGTAGASTDLDDITISGTPLDGTTAAATYTATVMLRYDISAFKFFNPTITSSGGSNDADFDLYVRFS